MKKLLNVSCLLLVLLFSIQKSYSQSTSWKGTTNANWNAASNWTNGIPDNTKDVIIGDINFTGINQPKVNIVSSCKSITIGGAVIATINVQRTLTVSGNININANGTLLNPAATLYLAGNFTNNGAYNATANTSRIICNGVNQIIGGTSTTAFRMLQINAGSTITLASNISVTGAGSNLAVYGTIDPGQSPTYMVTSTNITKVYADGKLNVNTATFTGNYDLTGTTTLYSGSIVDYSSTTVNQVISPIYTYSTLMISGTGTKSLTANLPLLYGRSPVSGKILVTGGTFDLGTFTANRATNTNGGQLSVSNGAFMKIGATSNFPVGFATRTFGVSSTVEYNGVDQIISAQTYGNLLLSTAGIKTATTACNIMGDFTINNATFNTNAVVVTHSVGGNFTMTGSTVTGTNYTFAMTGTANQLMNLPITLNKLTINNTGGSVLLGADITITNTLNFIKGNIQTGTHNVIIPPSATITGAGQSTGWVNGNLQKNIPTGPAIFKTFEIGDAYYSPIMILFASVAIAGDLVTSTRSTDHSEINYSGVDPSKDVNRYWSMTNMGFLFTSAFVTFNWNAADLDGGAVTANFKAGSFNGSGWTMPTVNSPLATSIQLTGLTSLGDFCVGEKIGRSTWTGDAMTSDWFTPKNWLGLIPSTDNPTLIPNGITGGRVYPVISSGTATVGDINVEIAASLTVSAATLKIAGALNSTNNVTASAGTIEFNGSTAQTIVAGAFAGNTIKDLIVSNNLAMSDINIVTGTLTVANGKTLTTNDNLILKSDASGTARVAPLPVDGSGNATAFITGSVSVERYIPARKAWRLLSAPIQTASTITIADAWQEGAYGSSSFSPNPNPNPGYGVHIAGGLQSNGFDQSPTNSATLKVYSSAVNGFVAFPSTPGTFVPIKSYSGYMIYIRGDRSIDLSQGNAAAITSTTLRMKGSLNTGSQVSTVNATNFTVLGNPYPSPIDFATITKNNVKNSFYVWDPQLSGSNGLGGYVTVSWNSGTNSYDVTTSASPVSQYIPSGEAVLVESLDAVNPGTITIKESDKTANGSDAMFGRNTSTGQKLRTNLYAQEANDSYSLLDGALTTYDASNSNKLDNNDIKKMLSESEGISLNRDGQILAIERRKTIAANDTSFLNITELKQRNYKLEIITEQIDSPGCIAVLKDKYDAAINNTMLAMNGTTEIAFSVTDNPASFAADRFCIVFSKASEAAVFAFKSVKATLQQKNISVEWQTVNESAISNYEIEGSADGSMFRRLSALNSKAGTGTGYSWFDLNAAPGDHYYRISSSSKSGDKKASAIVKVIVPGAITTDSKKIIVYPNPVKNNVATLQLAYLERGMYIIEVTNINGQMLKRLSLLHNGGTIKYTLPLDKNMPSGKYQVKLTDGANVNFITSMIKE